MTNTLTTLRAAKSALETGLHAVCNYAEDVHEKYAGYYPERHASAERDVTDVRNALDNLTALIASMEAQEPAWIVGEDGLPYPTNGYGIPGTKLYTHPVQPSEPKAEPPKVSFEDHRVQDVYVVLCSDEVPPTGEHWEGFAARRIVDLFAQPKAEPVKEPHPPHRQCGCDDCKPSFEAEPK
jgi:hypothetical protein